MRVNKTKPADAPGFKKQASPKMHHRANLLAAAGTVALVISLLGPALEIFRGFARLAGN